MSEAKNEVTFVVTREEANLLGAALAELPFKVSAGLVVKLQQQAAVQAKAQEEKTEKPE